MAASSLSFKGAALRPALSRRSVVIAVAAASPASSSSSSSDSTTREKKKEKKKPQPTPTTLDATATPLPPSFSSLPREEEEKEEPPRTSPETEEDFDWRSQWYPVCYLEDLRESPGGVVRVSLFDEPVAVALAKKKKEEKGAEKTPPAGTAKDGGGVAIIALADRCSHRGAALSEGRVTAAGCLQCPYHAWTFDAGGSCVAIPHAPGAARRELAAAAQQQAKKKKRAAEAGSSSSPPCSPSAAAAAAASSRTRVRAYAATVSQGLVWLSPSPPETAPPPSRLPTLPELDRPGWVSADFVRDFEGIDFPLLVQNVADPDHGLFAHQTPSFDAFSAAAGMPMRVSTRRRKTGAEEGAAVIVGRVEAAPVLTKKGDAGASAATAAAPPSSSSPSVAELVFEPPCHVRWARMDAVEGGGREGGKEEEAKFIAAFWVTPLGLGRSRLFIRYARCLLPGLPVPRPLLAVALNGFLDQDSMVVASQALRVARAEAEAAAAREEEEGEEGKKKLNKKSSLSRSLFAYRSPTEPFLASIASWLDAALPAAPGRDARALRFFVERLEASNGGYPDREEVLDRFKYHTALVPSSKKVWERAKKVEEAGRAAALVAAAAALATLAATIATEGGTTSAAAAVAPLAAAAVLASLSSLAASDVASRFEYRYTRERQAADLGRIADLAPEVERASKEEPL